MHSLEVAAVPNSWPQKMQGQCKSSEDRNSAQEKPPTPSRKRKPEAAEEAVDKRCKDGAAKRAPLRALSDAENNRQASVAPSNLKAEKYGGCWLSGEKENECIGKLQVDKAGTKSVAGSGEFPTAPASDNSSLLLSSETLDKTAVNNAAPELKASNDVDAFQSNEGGEGLENNAECTEEVNWNELNRPVLWQLSCDLSGPVAGSCSATGLGSGMPMHGPLLNPVPIVQTHALGDQKILVLDMDETLVHASAQELPSFDFKVVDPFAMCGNKISVKKRPHVEYFLEQVSKLFKVVVFTAGTKEYATQVLDELDPSGALFAHRLFRDHCVLVGHLMVKDLRLVTTHLSQVMIVDNTPSAYLLQRENGIHIPSYFGTDCNDCELLRLLPLLEKLAEVDDVRPLIIHHASCLHQFQLNPHAAEFQPVASSQPHMGSEHPTTDATQFQLNPHATQFQPETSTQQELVSTNEKLSDELSVETCTGAASAM